MPTEHLFPYIPVALSDVLSWPWYSLLTPLNTQTLLGRGKCQQPDLYSESVKGTVAYNI